MNIRTKEVRGVLWERANSERNLMTTTEFRLGLSATKEEHFYKSQIKRALIAQTAIKMIW